MAEPDEELKLVSELLSERDEESDEEERRRNGDLREDPQGYLGSSKISDELAIESGRGVVERRDLV